MNFDKCEICEKHAILNELNICGDCGKELLRFAKFYMILKRGTPEQQRIREEKKRQSEELMSLLDNQMKKLGEHIEESKKDLEKILDRDMIVGSKP